MTAAQKWLGLAVLLGIALLIYLLGPVLVPFLGGALLAYLGNPLVDRFVNWRLSRTLAVVVVFAIFLLVATVFLILLVPLLHHQITMLIAKLPVYIEWLQGKILPLVQGYLPQQQTGFDVNAVMRALEQHWQQVGNFAARILVAITHSGLILLGWIANLVLIPLVAFYLLRDWRVLMNRLAEMVPRQAAPVVFCLARDCDRVLGAFLRGQLSVMLALAVVYALGLWLVGLDLALLIGVTAGLVSFIPYLGFIIGVLCAGIAAIVQFQDVTHLIPVVAVFGVGQLLESFVFTPFLIGDRVGLHPLAVIFAVMAGGQLFGFAGILLALPAAAVIMVLLRYAHERYLSSGAYGAKAG